MLYLVPLRKRSSWTTVAKQPRPTAELLSTFDSDERDFRCEIEEFLAQKAFAVRRSTPRQRRRPGDANPEARYDRVEHFIALALRLEQVERPSGEGNGGSDAAFNSRL